ncbi:MAG TPA: hypothetical protein ENI23_05890, partial [bacterium]|nr:hypothetical protein [bacterium]
MKILAIDMAVVNSAAAILEFKDGSISVVDTKIIKLPHEFKSMGSFMTAAYHRKSLTDILDTTDCDVVSIEGPNLRGSNLFSIGQVHFGLMGECMNRKKDIITMPIQTWKYI